VTVVVDASAVVAALRDAADVPLTHIFGPNTLSTFRVHTEEAQPM
jgi:hypothetical protein